MAPLLTPPAGNIPKKLIIKKLAKSDMKAPASNEKTRVSPNPYFLPAAEE